MFAPCNLQKVRAFRARTHNTRFISLSQSDPAPAFSSAPAFAVSATEEAAGPHALSAVLNCVHAVFCAFFQPRCARRSAAPKFAHEDFTAFLIASFSVCVYAEASAVARAEYAEVSACALAEAAVPSAASRAATAAAIHAMSKEPRAVVGACIFISFRTALRSGGGILLSPPPKPPNIAAIPAVAAAKKFSIVQIGLSNK